MFSKEYMSTFLILVEFLEKGHEICHLWEIPQVGTGTQIGVVLVPLNRTKVVPVPSQSGIGTNIQNRGGTCIDQSGTGINASCSPDFCIRTLINPNSYTDSI